MKKYILIMSIGVLFFLCGCHREKSNIDFWIMLQLY